MNGSCDQMETELSGDICGASNQEHLEASLCGDIKSPQRTPYKNTCADFDSSHQAEDQNIHHLSGDISNYKSQSDEDGSRVEVRSEIAPSSGTENKHAISDGTAGNESRDDSLETMVNTMRRVSVSRSGEDSSESASIIYHSTSNSCKVIAAHELKASVGCSFTGGTRRVASEIEGKCSLCRTEAREVKLLPCSHPLCLSCYRLCTGDLARMRCGVCHCDTRDHQSEEEAETGAVLPEANVHPGFCSVHQEQSLRFYCHQCATPICISCVDQAHAAHATYRLEESLDLQRSALSSLQLALREKVELSRHQMSLVCDLLAREHDHFTDQSQRVNSACDSLARALQSRRSQLLAEVQNCYAKKTSRLKEQKEMLQTGLVELDACCNFVDNTLRADLGTETLLLSKQVAMRLRTPGPQHLSAYHTASSRGDASREQIIYRFSDDNISALQQRLCEFGSVRSSAADDGSQMSSPLQTEAQAGFRERCFAARTNGEDAFFPRCPSNNGVEVHSQDFIDGASVATDAKGGSTSAQFVTTRPQSSESAFALTATKKRRIPCRLPLPARGVTVSSPCALSLDGRSSGASRLSNTSNRSSRTSSGKSRSSCRSGERGRLCSPSTPATPTTYCFFVEEDDLVRCIGSRGRGKGQFSNPQGVGYCSANDRLLVADSNNQCVQVFSLDGTCRLRFGVRGRGPGHMQRPCGVTATAEGCYVVTDYESRCVSVHDKTGNFVKRFGTGKLQGPKGVLVDCQGRLLVVDNRGCCVVAFSTATGRMVARFGSRGSDRHQLAGPHYAATDSRGRVIVTDFHNHAVKVFTGEGMFLTSFGGHGESDGLFNSPTGVAVDSGDNILVADWGNSRIQVFDSQGRFISGINSLASSLFGPQGLVMCPGGQVAVADSGNHTLKLYSHTSLLY